MVDRGFNMHRFYSLNCNVSSGQLTLTDQEELHHLSHVVRLKKGSKISVFDGKGREATGIIESISSKKARVNIQSVTTVHCKSPKIILACAIPKKTKFEMIIEKATELGVDEIIPLKTKRTEVILNKERAAKKQKRYQMVVINAAKQSGRAFMPTMHPVTNFTQALSQFKDCVMIIPSLMGPRENLWEVLEKIKSPRRVVFFVGPEGDFTPKEYALAQEAGCHAVTLGDTVLKVETAALCALSCARLFFHTSSIA